MGDALVSALVKEVLKRLTSEVIKEFGLLRGLGDDILSLKEDFKQNEALLEDAERKRSQENAIDLWLKNLKSACLEAENVLDEISTEALLQRLHKKRVKYRVRAFFSSNHNKFMSRVRIAHKVKAIRRKMDVISSKGSELSLTCSAIGHVDVDLAREMPQRETSSLIHDSLLILGRDEEIDMVTELICNKDIGKYENGEIRVYSIWGMGGIGKTTLAQLVYNHATVSKYFDLKCWVYVSENFQVKEIIKGIITSIDKYECTITHLDVLQETLQRKLMGRKFLIVLDDVWIEGAEKSKWEELSKTLSCGVEGSIVVMTTRSKTTSRMVSKIAKLQHELECLSQEDSWLLFKKLAFAEGREGGGINELKCFGREILDKCKGLPLAVKTLGSLMWSKSKISDWQNVKNSTIWELPESNVFLLPALKLSYDNLLPHLKRCFAYCCLFPKGYEIKKNLLIRLWLSNDFIPPRGEIDLYVLGEEIFNCLVWRSFILKVKNIFSCYEYKIHDLMHDMAHHMMRHDYLICEGVDKKLIIPNEVFHLSSSCPDFIYPPENVEQLRSVRSILVFGNTHKWRINQVYNHMYLRVLYLPFTKLKTLPKSICKLKHLRYQNLSSSSIEVLPRSIIYLQNLQYLNLSTSEIKVLPESIMYLQNLQYLNLSYSKIEVLPESIIYLRNLQVLLLRGCQLFKLTKGLRYMRNLQHLDIKFCSSLMHLPTGIKELTNLQINLSVFPVGKENGAKIGELGNLNLLGEWLHILKLENVRGLSEAKSANLKSKTTLLDLDLRWSGRHKYAEEVLEGLEPNPYLKKLQISLYMGKIVSPSWMVSLSNLVEIKLFGCLYCEHIPALGRLPNLRVIKLLSMHSLKCFHDDDTTNIFHCLQKLRISNCMYLVSLPSNIPKLEVMNISRCGKLVSLPGNLPSIKELRLEECDGLLSLPDEIFKDLNELKIYECQYLSKRYEEEIGEDWSKISHIPCIRITPPRHNDEDEDEDGEEVEDEDEVEFEDDEKKVSCLSIRKWQYRV